MMRFQKVHEAVAVGVLRIFAWLSAFATLAIIFVLVSQALGFFEEVSIKEFLVGTQWTPLFKPRSFGVLPILMGTLTIALYSSLVSLPLGIGAALYLSEYAGRKTRKVIKPAIEILAGIPSIVFGYFALTFLSPLVQTFFPSAGVFNALSASIVVGIMTLPMVASLSDDAFQAVPRHVKDGAYALGATKSEVLTSVLLPAASSGILASFILAFSRAVGETMAVSLAAGATPNMGMDPLQSLQTMTAYIVQVSLGDTPHGTVEYKTIFAVGLLLFLLTFCLNLTSQLIFNKLKKVSV